MCQKQAAINRLNRTIKNLELIRFAIEQKEELLPAASYDFTQDMNIVEEGVERLFDDIPLPE